MLLDNSATWFQGYDPAHHWWLSTFWAGLPLLMLLVLLIGFKLRAHTAALIALAAALIVAAAVFSMPVHLALLATVLGAGYGLFPIFWIIFPVIFMYQLTVRAGRFKLLHESLIGVTEDSRLQLLLIAFILGAFFEGAAGFGTPVAVCGTILLGLGFSSLEAAGLTLLANTAPVAFGALGIPVVALAGVTGLNTLVLTHVIAALLTPFCVLVPFWLQVNDGNLASNPGRRGYVWRLAAFDCDVARSVAGGHHCSRGELDGVRPLSEGLETKEDSECCAARCDGLSSLVEQEPCACGDQSGGTVGDPDSVCGGMGDSEVYEMDRFDQCNQASGARTRSCGFPHASGRGSAYTGGCGLHVQLALSYGNRNLYRRAYCRCGDGA
jgi:hypothetical protein